MADTITFDQMMAIFKEAEKRQAETDRMLKDQFRETDRMLKERALEAEKRQAEMDRWAKERALEFEKYMKEMEAKADKRAAEAAERSKEADKRMKQLEKQVGGLHNSLGALVEAFLAANIETRFPARYGLKCPFRNVKVYNSDYMLVAEIDIMLTNGELAVIIEVKRKAEARDVERHALEQMKLLQDNPPAEARGKKLMAGIGFIEASLEARKAIEQYGMFAVELNGESVNVIEPSKRSPTTEW
jgi:hypothetical protein